MRATRLPSSSRDSRQEVRGQVSCDVRIDPFDEFVGHDRSYPRIVIR
ncbi:MAG: hypothetical protein JWM76_3569 [Pseudonocardiales bacterium]|nr:hypothetical protein [Pseudonocardiales bacterium]